jgi:hypothetical protein
MWIFTTARDSAICLGSSTACLLHILKGCLALCMIILGSHLQQHALLTNCLCARLSHAFTVIRPDSINLQVRSNSAIAKQDGTESSQAKN